MNLEIRSTDRDHWDWVAAHLPEGLGSVLDLGCGSGYLCSRLSHQGVHCVGIDLKPPPNHNAESPWHYLNLNLNGAQWSQTLKPFAPFDVIFGFDIIEHLNSPFEFLHHCRKILHPRGLVFVTTPNINSWEAFLRPKHWSGVIDPEHKQLFSPYSLEFLFERCGFKVLQLKAPIRKLGRLQGLLPRMGGQTFLVASKREKRA